VSIANPQNRSEFKQYLLTKLGAPVLQVNVSDEQLDLCINDAFQYFNEREHFNGTERVYYRVKLEETFLKLFKSAEEIPVEQSQSPQISGAGMVSKLQLVRPGTGYPTPTKPYINQKTSFYTGERPDHPIYFPGPQGSGLTVDWAESRTVEQGIVSCSIHETGTDYRVGDWVVLDGGNNDCIFQVAEVNTSNPLHGLTVWEKQRNYVIMPDDVLGVSSIVRVGSAYGVGAGVVPAAFFTNPFLMGGAGGMGQCGQMGFDILSYFMFKQYLAEIDFMFRKNMSYEFNQRTHRLHLNSGDLNGAGVGDYMVFECAVKPSPDIFPDLWTDRWLKRYATALTKKAWGQNLTKYQQVQLPGGITLNGDMIYNEGKEEIMKLEERFSMDEAAIPLDMVG
jgi:hypothetical protein